MRRTIVLILTMMLSIIVSQPVAAQSDMVAAGLKWILGQQQADGSFAGFGPGDTADAIVALVAGGEQLPASALNFLAGQAASYGTSSAGATAKVILAAVAAGRDPLNFGGVNLARQLGTTYDPATGQYGADVYGMPWPSWPSRRWASNRQRLLSNVLSGYSFATVDGVLMAPQAIPIRPVWR